MAYVFLDLMTSDLSMEMFQRQSLWTQHKKNTHTHTRARTHARTRIVFKKLSGVWYWKFLD